MAGVFGRVLLVAGLILALAGVGCESSSPVLVAKGRAEIPVGKSDHPHATVRLFDEVILHLPPIETPGNVWTLVLNDERYFQERGTITPEPGGGAVAKYLAIRAGRRAIRFFALPPNRREAVPTQVYEVRIAIEEAPTS